MDGTEILSAPIRNAISNKIGGHLFEEIPFGMVGGLGHYRGVENLNELHKSKKSEILYAASTAHIGRGIRDPTLLPRFDGSGLGDIIAQTNQHQILNTFGLPSYMLIVINLLVI